MSWNIGFTSVIGTSHEKNGLPCQDCSVCEVLTTIEGKEVLIALASDGAGSSKKSDVGSKLVVKNFLNDFSEKIKKNNNFFTECNRELIIDWIKTIQKSLNDLAKQESLPLKEYACTFLGSIIGPEIAIFFQIGDGAIVVSETSEHDYGYIFWPQHGEYANQTNFVVQENIEEILQFEIINKKFEQLALFTDGIERLVLDFHNQCVFSPAFKPIFEWLAKPTSNNLNECSNSLSTYLSSESINNRTDDDKTLIVAVRAKTEDDQTCKKNI